MLFYQLLLTPVDAEVLSAEPLRAKFIGNFGVGFNHIDLDAAKARGLTVTNTPEVLNRLYCRYRNDIDAYGRSTHWRRRTSSYVQNHGLVGAQLIC